MRPAIKYKRPRFHVVIYKDGKPYFSEYHQAVKIYKWYEKGYWTFWK